MFVVRRSVRYVICGCLSVANLGGGGARGLISAGLCQDTFFLYTDWLKALIVLSALTWAAPPPFKNPWLRPPPPFKNSWIRPCRLFICGMDCCKHRMLRQPRMKFTEYFLVPPGSSRWRYCHMYLLPSCGSRRNHYVLGGRQDSCSWKVDGYRNLEGGETKDTHSFPLTYTRIHVHLLYYPWCPCCYIHDFRDRCSGNFVYWNWNSSTWVGVL